MPTMREIAAGMGVPRIQKQNGHGPASSDPMAEAVQRRRQLMATRMEETTAAQLSAQELLEQKRLELEAEKLDLEAEAARAKLEVIRAERRQLAQQQGPQPGGDGALAAMLQVFTDSQARLVEAAEKREQTLLALLNDRIEAAQQAREVPAPAPLPTLAERLQEVQAVLELSEKFRPPQPPAPMGSVHDAIQLKELELRIEERRHELNERAALRLRELQGREQHQQGELDLRRQQVQAEIDRNRQMGNLVEQLGPGVLGVVAQQLQGRGEGGGQQAQPPGDLRRCANSECGGEFWSRPEQRGHMVHCPHCRQVQMLPPPAGQG